MKAKKAAGAAALLAASLLATPLVAQAPLVPKTMELGRGPTVVILHGLGGARMQWMPVARKLINDHHVVMVDLPGHGDTPMPDPFSLEACAAALDQVLAKQKPESTIVLGHGLGGVIVMLEAKAHPERFRGAIVIDAVLKPPMAIPDQQKRYFLEYMDANMDQFVKMTFTRMGRDSAEGVALSARAALVPSNNMKAYFHSLMDLDVSGGIKDLKSPVLYVGSSQIWPDTMAWAAIAKARGYEEATTVTSRRIGNSGVQIYSDQPDSLAQVIREFEAKVEAKK